MGSSEPLHSSKKEGRNAPKALIFGGFSALFFAAFDGKASTQLPRGTKTAYPGRNHEIR